MDDSKNKSAIAKLVIYMLIGLICLFAFVSCTSSRKEKARDAFKTQMQKDPSTWTESEKKHYNDFSEWKTKEDKKRISGK